MLVNRGEEKQNIQSSESYLQNPTLVLVKTKDMLVNFN